MNIKFYQLHTKKDARYSFVQVNDISCSSIMKCCVVHEIFKQSNMYVVYKSKGNNNTPALHIEHAKLRQY